MNGRSMRFVMLLATASILSGGCSLISVKDTPGRNGKTVRRVGLFGISVEEEGLWSFVQTTDPRAEQLIPLLQIKIDKPDPKLQQLTDEILALKIIQATRQIDLPSSPTSADAVAAFTREVNTLRSAIDTDERFESSTRKITRRKRGLIRRCSDFFLRDIGGLDQY